MSQYDDIYKLINERFVFVESDKLGKWFTATNIAQRIGVYPVTQIETRLINIILTSLLHGKEDCLKISRGYRMYYLKGR